MPLRDVAAALAVLVLTPAPSPAADAVVHAVLLNDGMVTLDPLAVPDGETRTVEFARPGPVGMVLPFAPGASGDLIRDGLVRSVTLRNEDGELLPSVTLGSGATRALPPIALDDLARSEIRLSVTGPGLEPAAFFIAPGAPPVPDPVAPAVDFFGGKLPAQPGDVILTTEVTRVAPPSLEGAFALRVEDGRLRVRARLDGAPVELILDTGSATELVLAPTAVPEGVKLAPAQMTQLSSVGSVTLPMAAGGAQGQVDVKGVYAAGTLQLGSVRARDVPVLVVGEAAGRVLRERLHADGIVGLPFLRRAGAVTLELGAERPRVRLERHATPAPGAIELPMSVAMGHPVVRMGLGGVSVPMVLDTGAPTCFLTPAAADGAGVEVGADAITASGLEGAGAEFYAAAAPGATLGGRDIGSLPVRVGPLPVLDKFGGEAGLLGTDLLARHNAVTIDFETRRVLLNPIE